MHKLSDIPGGVSVATSELGGDYLREGAVLSAPIDGISHVVKVAVLAAEAAADATTLVVKKGHNLKVGDIVTNKPGSAAYDITAIEETSKTTDTIKLSKTLGVAIALGGFVVEAKAASAASALKYTPKALAGTGKHFDRNGNLDVDAWLHGVTKGHELPEFIASALPGIINY
jgi:hypothetical protein